MDVAIFTASPAIAFAMCAKARDEAICIALLPAVSRQGLEARKGDEDV